MKRIAIVGAGISGLTAGYELKKLGLDVTVYEKEPLVGGRMSTRVKDGFHFDIGADHLCNLYTHMQAYCRELNIEWQKMEFDDYGIIKKHRVIPLINGISHLEKVRLGLLTKAMHRVKELFNFNNLIAYDTQDASSYAQRYVGQETHAYYIDGFTSAYQFHRAKELSLAPFLAVLNSITRDGSAWDLHRTKGGMIALPQALANQLNVKTSTTVISINSTQNGAKITLEDDTKDQFDAVILTAPAPLAKKLIQNPTPETTSLLEQSKFATTISIAFRIAKGLLPKKGVTWVPFAESQIISSYSNQTMKGEECVKGDQSLVCIWLHESAAKNLITKNDEEIASIASQELCRITDWLKNTEQIQFHDIQRWDHAMPKFDVGHQKRVAEYLERHQGKNHLYLCGDYMNALWTEGALRFGQDLARKVKNDLDSISVNPQ